MHRTRAPRSETGATRQTRSTRQTGSTAQTKSTPRALSLLELLIVLAIVSLVTALVAPGAARLMLRDAERETMVELVDFLAARRLEALRAGGATHITLTRPDPATLVVSSPDRALRWDARRVLHVGDDGRVVDEAAVLFQPTGRASRRDLAFVTQPSGRIWVVEFDPLTGVPSARPRGQ